MAKTKVIDAQAEKAETKPQHTRDWHDWQIYTWDDEEGYWECQDCCATKADAERALLSFAGCAAAIVHIHIPAMDY